MRRKSLAFFAAAVAMVTPLALAGTAMAGSIFYDFEGLATGSSKSLQVTSPDLPQPITVTAADGSAVKVVDLSGFSGTTAFGSRSLQAADGSNSPLIITFPVAVSSVSVQAGHIGGSLANLSLNAFKMNGASAGSASDSLLGIGGFFNFKPLSVNGSGIHSIELFGGTGGVNSTFFDNLGATTSAGPSAVPLPPAVAMFPVGILAAGFAMRKMRRTAAVES